MRCTACGSDRLEPMNIITEDLSSADVRQIARSYVCLNCRHMELYADEMRLEQYLAGKNDKKTVKSNGIVITQ